MKSEIITIKNSAYSDETIEKIVSFLNRNKIIIMPSDTIYGFLTKKSNKERLRRIKRRDNKPFLFLISQVNDLQKMNINYKINEKLLKQYWPGAVTFIMKTNDNKTQGVRLPDLRYLKEIIKRAGEPLLSTSVNYSGESPMENIELIIKEFGDKADLIIADYGFRPGNSSTIADITKEPFEIIRKGSVEVVF